MLDLVAAGGEITPCDERLDEIRTGYGLLVTNGRGRARGRLPVCATSRFRPPTARCRCASTKPSDDGAALPVVVFFHGGGWTIGSIDDYDATARQIANRSGAIVVSVGYRLAPEHPFPAPLDDCWAATTWVAEHAADLGGDPDRLALMGDSAGGNIAAVLAQRCAREGGPLLALQVLVYPVVDCDLDTGSYRENGKGYLLDTDEMRWFFDCYSRGGTALEDPTISPLRAPDLHDGTLRDLAPAFVITAEYDPLRDEGEAYAAALRAAGVETRLSRYDGMIHAFFGLGAGDRAGQRRSGRSRRGTARGVRYPLTRWPSSTSRDSLPI